MRAGVETPDGSRGQNLLENAGFEVGETAPQGWVALPAEAAGITYLWDGTRSQSGNRSVCIESTCSDGGMWQQVVDVEAGRVYALAGYVAFEDVKEEGKCNLQLVFRDAVGDVVQAVDYPGHTGTREFAYDFPHDLCVRAPANAVRAEVNLCLRGSGKAWFDDVFFGLVRTGEIRGRVTCEGKPLEGARVYIWGDPWGKVCEAFTDAGGRYALEEIPVAYPRYILMAGKDGYRTRIEGRVVAVADGVTTVDFEVTAGSDPDDLRVKYGALAYSPFVRPPLIPEGATIPADASGYPAAIRCYLESDDYIQPDHPEVQALAKEIVDTLSVEDRSDTRKVAWAVYEWVVKYIDHDSVYAPALSLESLEAREEDMLERLSQPYKDVTSGIWQTVSKEGWCWGKNFYDWGYRPYEALKVRCCICAEHSWLVAALYRSLNIPARVCVGSYEFWAQTSGENGVWVHGSSTAGRMAYRDTGKLGVCFEGMSPEPSFSVLSRPILHEDWDAQNSGVWRETHPSLERYEATPAGRARALADLNHLAATGEARHGIVLEEGRDFYLITYSDVTINLFNMGDQRTLDVRFPMVTDSGPLTPTWDVVHWTNHPECVKRTWIEEIPNPPAEGAERWYHVEFDLTSILDGGPGMP